MDYQEVWFTNNLRRPARGTKMFWKIESDSGFHYRFGIVDSYAGNNFVLREVGYNLTDTELHAGGAFNTVCPMWTIFTDNYFTAEFNDKYWRVDGSPITKFTRNFKFINFLKNLDLEEIVERNAGNQNQKKILCLKN